MTTAFQEVVIVRDATHMPRSEEAVTPGETCQYLACEKGKRKTDRKSHYCSTHDGSATYGPMTKSIRTTVEKTYLKLLGKEGEQSYEQMSAARKNIVNVLGEGEDGLRKFREAIEGWNENHCQNMVEFFKKAREQPTKQRMSKYFVPPMREHVHRWPFNGNTNEDDDGKSTFLGLRENALGNMELMVPSLFENGVITSGDPDKAEYRVWNHLVSTAESEKEGSEKEGSEALTDLSWVLPLKDFLKATLVLLESRRPLKGRTFRKLSILFSLTENKPQVAHLDMFGTHKSQVLVTLSPSYPTSFFDYILQPTGHGSKKQKKRNTIAELVRRAGSRKEIEALPHLVSQAALLLLTDSEMKKDDGPFDDGRKLQPQIGHIAVLPGNVVHAAPASDKARCVFFCESSSPGAEEYNQDDQYRGVDILNIIMNNGNPDREKMKAFLERYLGNEGSEETKAHCRSVAENGKINVELKEMIKNILKSKMN